MLLVLLVVLAGLPARAVAQAVTAVPPISTVAGNGTAGSSGNNGLATIAEINSPYGVALDAVGNLYIADSSNNVVREVIAATQVIVTVAGNGTLGSTGDGGLATSAKLNHPTGVAVDSLGNIYIADQGNNRIREVAHTNHYISTVAGSSSSTAGFSGDGALATSALLSSPTGVALDSSGSIYIADQGNNRIRKVVYNNHYISTLAGSSLTAGFGGDNALATSALLSSPTGVALDSAGNVYIADQGNNRIRKVTRATLVIGTVAGSGSTPGFSGDGGAATSAKLDAPAGVALDAAGTLYIADSSNYCIRAVNASTQNIATIAGNEKQGSSGDNGAAVSAELGLPTGVTLDALGNIYISDKSNNRIRKVVVAAVNWGTASIGSTSSAQKIFLSVNSNLSISSISVPKSQGAVQEFSPGAISGCTVGGVPATTIPAGTICTVPLTFHPGYPGLRQVPLVVQTSSSAFQFGLTGTGQGPQVALLPGTITTAAGNGSATYDGDGVAPTSTGVGPFDMAMDAAGNLYIADYTNNSIREVSASTNLITTIAGTGTPGFSGDGGAATAAKLSSPTGLALDAAGDIYIADSGNNRIREVSASTHLITTVAGGTQGFSGDGSAAVGAYLSSPTGVAVDAGGNLYIADYGNDRIREINAATQVITTVAGSGTEPGFGGGYTGDGGPATSATLSSPAGVGLDASGNLYIADSYNSAVREVNAVTQIITTVVGSGSYGYSGDGGQAIEASLGTPTGVTVDAAGNLYIVDQAQSVIRKVDAFTQNINTVAGNESLSTFSGDGLAATSAELSVPYGVALDSGGNLYIADSGNNRIRRVSVTVAPLNFASVIVGSSSDEQNISVSNTGNALLTFSSISIANDFTGPDISCSTGQPLAAGATCGLGIEFAPTIVGLYSGSVVLVDNTLNVSNTQTITLSGTAQPLPQPSLSTVSVTSLNNSVYSNQSTTLTAAVSVGGNGASPTGTATFYNGGTQIGAAVGLSPVDASDSTATLSLSAPQLALGANSITAIYSGDTNYAGSNSAATTITLLNSQTTFGSANVKTPATTQTLTYNFSSATTLSAVNILTAGAPGLDYTDGGSSTCIAGPVYSAGQSCVVTVAFTPSVPGVRSGGVTLFAQGTTLPLQTWYLSGVGQASAVTIDPGTQTALATLGTSGQAYGSAIDGAGNIYVVDHVNNAVVEFAAETFSPTTIVSSGLVNPTAAALDGAGNLYISDTGNSRVVVVPNEQGTLNGADISTVSINGAALPSGLGSPSGLAVDSGGNLYVADGANGVVVEVPMGGGTATTVASGLTTPQGVAVDAAGNIYITSNSQVAEYPAGGGAAIPMGSGYTTPVGVAVDASGTIYVADLANSQIVVVAPGGASQENLAISGVTSPQSVMVDASAGVTSPQSVMVDASANVYVTAGGSVYEVNRTQAAPLTFPLTLTGFTSSPQTLTVSDAGNQQLTVSNLTIPASFTQASSGGTDCSSSMQLASAGQCLIAVESEPTVSGTIAGALTLGDNALGTASTQTVPLSGTALYWQTITFPNPGTQTYGTAVTLTASASSGLPVVLTSSTPLICTVAGTTVTLLSSGPGVCTIQANQAGGGTYAQATRVGQSFVVTHEAQTITFANPGSQFLSSSSTTLTASASTGLPVSLASTTPSICAVSGTTAMLLAPGNCTIQATQAGNSGVFSAPSVSQTFAVTLVGQTITFANPGAQIYGASPTLTATVSSRLPITFTSSTLSICTVTGTTVTLLSSGNCTVQATQAGNSTYGAAPTVSQSFTVSHESQSISFTNPGSQLLSSSPTTLTASASTGLPVSLVSTTPSICSVSGTTATLLSPGTCTIQATQAGNFGVFSAPSVSQTFAITLVGQTITFANPGAQIYGASPTLTATVSSRLPITFTSSTLSICTVTGTTVTLLSSGNCTVQATQAGNSTYGAAPTVSQSFTVAHESQSISFTNPGSQLLSSSSTTLTASASTGLPVSLASTTPSICAVSGTTAMLLAPGNCTIQATQAGNSGVFSAPSVSQTFAVTLVGQTITFANPGAQIYGASPTLTATVSSRLPITFTSSTLSICTVTGTTVTLLSSGNCTVQATQAGNSTYGAAPTVSQSFTVSHESQSISFTNPGSQLLSSSSATLTASASTGLPVSLASTTPSICAVTGTAAMLLAPGNCTIQATQAGNFGVFSAPSVSQTFAVK